MSQSGQISDCILLLKSSDTKDILSGLSLLSEIGMKQDLSQALLYHYLGQDGLSSIMKCLVSEDLEVVDMAIELIPCLLCKKPSLSPHMDRHRDIFLMIRAGILPILRDLIDFSFSDESTRWTQTVTGKICKIIKIMSEEHDVAILMFQMGFLVPIFRDFRDSYYRDLDKWAISLIAENLCHPKRFHDESGIEYLHYLCDLFRKTDYHHLQTTCARILNRITESRDLLAMILGTGIFPGIVEILKEPAKPELVEELLILSASVLSYNDDYVAEFHVILSKLINHIDAPTRRGVAACCASLVKNEQPIQFFMDSYLFPRFVKIAMTEVNRDVAKAFYKVVCLCVMKTTDQQIRILSGHGVLSMVIELYCSHLDIQTLQRNIDAPLQIGKTLRCLTRILNHGDVLLVAKVCEMIRKGGGIPGIRLFRSHKECIQDGSCYKILQTYGFIEKD